eukprot:541001_1
MATKMNMQQRKFQFFYETKTWTPREQQLAIMIIGISHIPIALSLINIGRQEGRWHIFLFIYYIIASISRNISYMLTPHRLYLHHETWTKLTYISGISLWNLSIIYLMDISKYPVLRALLEYLQFAFILIIQEDKPQSYEWNWYPILIHIIIFILIQLYSIIISQKMPKYNYKNLAISLTFFTIAYLCLLQVKAPFTYDAEKETSDYLRIYYSLCDLFIGIGFHWFWKVLPPHDHQQVKTQ